MAIHKKGKKLVAARSLPPRNVREEIAGALADLKHVYSTLWNFDKSYIEYTLCYRELPWSYVYFVYSFLPEVA